MTSYDLHRYQVNLTMVSAHYALETLYNQFGPDLIMETLHSFEEREEAYKNTPTDNRLGYQKGSNFLVK